jgi:hypothetical protein
MSLPPTRVRVSVRRLPQAETLRGAARRGSTLARRRLNATRTTLRRRLPPLVMVTLALLALALVVVVVAMIFVPAGLIVAGLALLGILTFNPATVRKITWPR